MKCRECGKRDAYRDTGLCDTCPGTEATRRFRPLFEGYRPPPSQPVLCFGPPEGTHPEARCRCRHFAQQHGNGACGRCGCTVWRPAPACARCNGSGVQEYAPSGDVEIPPVPLRCLAPGCEWGHTGYDAPRQPGPDPSEE